MDNLTTLYHTETHYRLYLTEKITKEGTAEEPRQKPIIVLTQPNYYGHVDGGFQLLQVVLRYSGLETVAPHRFRFTVETH